MGLFYETGLSSLQRKVGNEIQEIVRNFQKCSKNFPIKVALYKKLKSNFSVTLLSRLWIYANQQRRFINHEECVTSTAVQKIQEIIDIENQKSYGQAKYTYSEYKQLVSLKHIIESLSQLLISQSKILRKMQDTGLIDVSLEHLFYTESVIFGKEKETLEQLEIVKSQAQKYSKLVVGYGSLLNLNSLFDTLKNVSEDAKSSLDADPKRTIRERVIPVMVYGYKRIFNLTVKPTSIYMTEEHIRKKMLGTLGIQASPRSYFNAIAIRVTDEEFAAILEREKSYNYKKVPCMHLLNGAPIRDAYIGFPKPVQDNYIQDPKKIDEFFKHRKISYSQLPPLRYYLLCLVGVRKLDEYLGLNIMAELFRKTTYLPDISIDYDALKLISDGNKKLRRSIFKYNGFVTIAEFESRDGRINYGGHPITQEMLESPEKIK